MATFTITGNQNWDELSGKAGGDTYNIVGGTLTIDQDTRYGLNTTTTTGPATAITTSATDGGTLEVDARYVRLIPYDGGNAANAPAGGTTVTAGSATGKLICFLSSLTAAPVAVGAATPAAGWIKIKQWNSVAYADNTAITFSAGTVTCNVNGTDRVGWISLVNDESGTITGTRLGTLRFRGAWYEVGVVSGNSRVTAYALPTAGEAIYPPGVQVETSPDSGVYEWYPHVGSQSALLANVGTEAARGKVCWITSAGSLRFGYDGSNQTGGYLPPDGCHIRIPNIYMHSCTTAARQTNQVPNSTVGTRFEFAATGAQIIMDTVSTSWYLNILQAYSLSLNHVAINDLIVVQELASAASWDDLCIGVTAAQVNTPITFLLNLAGGTITNSVFATYSLAGSGRYAASITDCLNWTFTNVYLRNIAANRGNNTSGLMTMIRANNFIFNNLKLVGGRVLLTTCWDVEFHDTIYIDQGAVTTPTTYPMYAIDTGGGGCTDILVDGLTFGGVDLVQPYNGLLQIGLGTARVKMRNIGTAQAPLDLGSTRRDTVYWSRSGAVASGNVSGLFNHNLKVGDIIYVHTCDSLPSIPVGAKTITAPLTSGVFGFACTNAGATNGYLSYYPTMSQYGVLFASNAAANDVKIQRVYTHHNRTSAYSADNSNKNVLFESFWSDQPNTAVTPILNCKTKGFQSSHALTAQTNPVYGSHWVDAFTTGVPASSLSQRWDRVGTNVVVTSSGHNLRNADRVVVTNTSSERAIRCGAYTTLLSSGINKFSLVGINAGDANGTLSYIPENGRIILLANEASDLTTSYVVKTSGNPNFTAAGTVYFPVSGDMMTWETPEYILGHTSFPIDEPFMGAGTLSGYNFKYAIDKNDGAGYHDFNNLSYVRTAGSGTVYQKWVQMFDTTGVNSGDYIFGTNVAPLARADTIGPKTVYYSDPANSGNLGTVSGNLRFNQLPNEVIDPSGGIKLKIQAQSIVPSGAAWSSLVIYTYSNDYARQFQYTLDTATVTLTGLVTGSRVKATKVSDGTLLFNGAESAGSISFDTSYMGAIRLEARQATNEPYYKPFVTQVTSVANTTVSAVALQQLD